jgi:rod shape-determining protein MreC
VGEHKPLFLRQRFLHLRLVVWLSLALLLMALDGRSVAVGYLRQAIGVVVAPIYLVEQLPFVLYRWSDWSLTPRAELLERLRVLERDNLILTARSQKYAALESENMRLRELLGASLDLGDRLLVAELLPSALEPGVQKVLLNRGRRDDVYVGQPFVDASGVMGQVVRVMPSRSIGLLITDPSHALPVESNRSGVRAIAVGTSLGTLLELAYVPNNADLAKGDLLVTSGLGGRFPPGYPVGRVISVEIDPVSPFARVLAEPSASMLRSREVLLLWSDNEGQPAVDESDADETTTANGRVPAS